MKQSPPSLPQNSLPQLCTPQNYPYSTPNKFSIWHIFHFQCVTVQVNTVFWRDANPV